MEKYIKPQVEIIEIDLEQCILNFSQEIMGYSDEDDVDYIDR